MFLITTKFKWRILTYYEYFQQEDKISTKGGERETEYIIFSHFTTKISVQLDCTHDRCVTDT